LSVKLRLTRLGRKKLPFYRIIAIDSKTRRDGKYLEKIGYYNPIPVPAEIVIDKEKALKWLDLGAIPSDTVNSLLRKQGIILEWDLKKRGLDPEKIALELQKWQDLQLERVKRQEAMKAMEQRKTGKKEAEKVKEETAAAEIVVEAVAEPVVEAKPEAEEKPAEEATPAATE